jgi:hypothetical protein
LGLLIAFTFSGAAGRFDTRRDLIVDETNAIETAYLRLDLLPPAARAEIQDLFQQYVEARIEIYRSLPDLDAAYAQSARSERLQQQIWTESIEASSAEDVPVSSAIVLLPALNTMIDLTTKRTMATQMHPPLVIFGMLFALSLVAALLAGYAMAERQRRSWLHTAMKSVVLDALANEGRQGFVRFVRVHEHREVTCVERDEARTGASSIGARRRESGHLVAAPVEDERGDASGRGRRIGTRNEDDAGEVARHARGQS